MATPIRIKRSSVPDKRPTLADLQLGEPAINTYDGRIYLKRDTGVGSTIALVTPWTENVGGSIYYNAGNTGIGTTNPTTKLHIVGDTLIAGSITATAFNGNALNVSGISTLNTLIVGNIHSSGIITATDFNSLSDSRYKENVATVTDALSKVERLRGVRFDWKESGLPSYGVIAQELQEVLPELVCGDDPRTVNYQGIIGVLIEAIKELKNEIEELKK